jgi:hypothetical protein
MRRAGALQNPVEFFRRRRQLGKRMGKRGAEIIKAHSDENKNIS